ncbi:Mu-like prophage major head subunit gpT family protein [Oceanibaculum sp.]|uniref:phage major capsid protein n=1 Tax=Oceanibaculum sp. TaxID=1903597 RepID=UPI00258A7DEF|nr:Mu-like prophage major head subunit gpT family protein [Oceanibaculum sp.]MCH2394319.1 Mu-like prophage major head subunit gpT family protein [Oceanibaculum sp.]
MSVAVTKPKPSPSSRLAGAARPNIRILRPDGMPRPATATEGLSRPSRTGLLAEAANCLSSAGVTVPTARLLDDPAGVFMEAVTHGSSDFAAVLGTVYWTQVVEQSKMLPAWIRVVGKKVDAPDFREIAHIRLGDMELKKLNETGEIEQVSIPEGGERWKLETYAAIFTLSRQLMTNDIDGAIIRAAGNNGRTIGKLEAKVATDVLTQNAGLGPMMADGKTCFHADHGNIGDELLDVEGLDAGRKRMRQQKALDGETPLNAPPKFLLVPSALETKAEQVLAELQPAKVEDTNPFSQKLDLVVEPRLDAVSETAWYLLADQMAVESVIYGNLRSAQGPMVELRPAWEQDGLGIRVIYDFAAAITDHQGVYRSSGDAGGGE